MKCNACADTGYYGDNGPGIKGNREYHEGDQCHAVVHHREGDVALAEAYRCGHEAGMKEAFNQAVNILHQVLCEPSDPDVGQCLERIESEIKKLEV